MQVMAKRAVLVGVNRYRIPGADLRGCVPDVKNMSKLLQRQYEFGEGDISILTDFDATKKAIEEAIAGLIKGGRRGDVLLVHYSGHGSNVPDNNGDEADNRDEILCPTDLDWYDPLRDDWLRNVFDGLGDGVSLTVITDSCHSGTITRAIEPPDAPLIERYLPSPWDLAAVESGRSLTGTTRGTLHQAPESERKARDIVPVDIPEVLISGCRADQTSADAAIGDGFAGALTYNLVEALTESDTPPSYRELHDQTCAKLKRGRYEQIPQLEGNDARLDQPFLSPLE
jgi:metacaspase-1